MDSERRSQIKSSQLSEKIRRDDLSKYLGELLIRQRAINFAAVSFASEFLPDNGLIVDACAGPEGSVLAARMYGWNWIGNDISERFAKDLRKSGVRNVVVSNFPESPYRANSVDSVFFIFALNNIADTQGGISEARRIIKKDGIILVADPGPSRWITTIIQHGITEGEGLSGKKFNESVPSYFASKGYSSREYAEIYCRECLGIEYQEMKEIYRVIVINSRTTKERDHRFHEEIGRLYFNNIENQAVNNGFELMKTGVILTGKTKGGNWKTSGVKQVEREEWIEEIEKTRNSKGMANGQIEPEIEHGEIRLVVPVLVFKKVS